MTVNWNCETDGHQFEMGSDVCQVEGCDARQRDIPPPKPHLEDRPTDDEILRVRRWECGNAGHTYNEIVEVGHNEPSQVICTNCGESWEVKPNTNP